MLNIQKRITSETGSATDVVSLADVKTYCRVDFTDDDSLLTDEITAAVRLVEDHCGVSLLAKSIEIIQDGPLDLWLPYGPVTSSSIALVDSNSNSLTVTTIGDEFPRVIYDGGMNESNYTLTYDTTVYSEGTVPAGIQRAIKLIVYANYIKEFDLMDEAYKMLQPHVKNWF